MAFVKTNEKGETEIHIPGEKFPIRGHARVDFLHGKLGHLKYLVKMGLKALDKCLSYEVPQENLKIPVRAFAEVMDDFIEAEQDPGCKDKWRAAKKAGVIFLEEDNAYCYRWQWLMERLAERIKDIKLSEGDKYYFDGYTNFKSNYRRQK